MLEITRQKNGLSNKYRIEVYNNNAKSIYKDEQIFDSTEVKNAIEYGKSEADKISKDYDIMYNGWYAICDEEGNELEYCDGF